jgi:glycosyltransferase involved in cell wall biosynthesis
MNETGPRPVGDAPESGVSFVIPAHNEEAAVPVVLKALQRIAKEQHLRAEFIVVDDGSTDQTAALAASHGARVVSIPMNVGYGSALKRGIEAASQSRIIIIDADDSYPVEYSGELLKRLDRFDLVIGRRTGTTYYRSLVTYPFRLAYLLLVWFVVGRRVPDPNSGFRAFRREAVTEFLPVMCGGFSFSTSMTTLFLLSGLTVDYVPIPYRRRIGRSKIRFVRDALRTGQILCSAILLYNPIKLFVLLSGATLLVGLLLVGAGFVAGGRLGLWLPGVLFVLFSGVFFCFGLMADLLANLRRRS